MGTEPSGAEVGAAVGAVLAAGKAVMEVYSGDFEVRTKSDSSPITEADTKSHEIMSCMLEKTGYPVLSEEGDHGGARRGSERVWIIDPLDGTADFAGRTGEFTVMAGLARGGAPEAGAIYWPSGGTLWAAQSGRGAFRRSGGGWERIRVSSESRLEMCRAVASRNHLAELDRRALENAGAARIDQVGSSLKVGRISGGEAELYVATTGKMREWDTCASCCILTEAGGRMTDTLGRPLRYNGDTFHRDGVVATNGIVHDAVLDAVKRARGP